MEKTQKFEVFLCGVGGQGILSITDILCNAAVKMGFRVRGSETHGMSQRGGTVFSNVRFGNVYSPLCLERNTDILLGFEPTEALRYAHFVKPDGYILVNVHPIPSPSFILSKAIYPDIKIVLNSLKEYCANTIPLNATTIAMEMGKTIIQNIIMLGTLSAIPSLPLSSESLLEALREQFDPKYFDLNKKALERGRKEFEKGLS